MVNSELSICICTVDRQECLERALESIMRGSVLPYEVIVSEDGNDLAKTEQICKNFPFVKLIKGPGHSLCANRNFVIKSATGTHISLMDDDAIATPNFVELAMEFAVSAPPKTILTGNVIENGILTKPTNPTFWGHFGKPLDNSDLTTIHLNCNVFPREAFDDATFDVRIKYGYEDIDVCNCLISHGYKIKHVNELSMFHAPPGRQGRKENEVSRMREVARYYTSLKKHMIWDFDLGKTLAYVLLAPIQRILHCVKTRKFHLIVSSVAEYLEALKLFGGLLRDRRMVRVGAEAVRIKAVAK